MQCWNRLLNRLLTSFGVYILDGLQGLTEDSHNQANKAPATVLLLAGSWTGWDEQVPSNRHFCGMLEVSQKNSPLESAVCAPFLSFPSSVFHIRQAAAPRGHTGRIISSVCLPLPHTTSSDLNRTPHICLQKECDLLTIESSSNLFCFEAISPHISWVSPQPLCHQWEDLLCLECKVLVATHCTVVPSSTTGTRNFVSARRFSLRWNFPNIFWGSLKQKW